MEDYGAEEDVGFTVTENDLLNRLATGELDGQVGGDLMMKSGNAIWLAIEKGIPTRYMEEATVKHIENGLITKIPGELKKIKEWTTEEEKLKFLRIYGQQVKNVVVNEYAKNEKERERREKAQEQKQPEKKVDFMRDRDNMIRIHDLQCIFPLSITRIS